MSEPEVQPPTWTEAETEAVLAAARVCQRPTVPVGCGGKSWAQIKRRRARDPEFAAAWEAAREEWLDTLEAVTEGAAINGYVERTVTTGPEGEVTETVYEKVDNRLRMSFLAARRPEVYGKRKDEQNDDDERRHLTVTVLPTPPDVHPKEGEEGAT